MPYLELMNLILPTPSLDSQKVNDCLLVSDPVKSSSGVLVERLQYPSVLTLM